MAMNATLAVSLSILDAANRQVSPVGPVRQSWSPVVLESKAVTLLAETDNTILVPDGATLVVMELGTAFDLLLKAVAGDAGIPLAATVNPLGLPAIVPLGDQADLVIENLDAADQVIRVTFL